MSTQATIFAGVVVYLVIMLFIGVYAAKRNHSIADFMTRGPISISADALAAEALQIIAKSRIDDLVVIGADGLPAGLVDSQDLARLKIV